MRQSRMLPNNQDHMSSGSEQTDEERRKPIWELILKKLFEVRLMFAVTLRENTHDLPKLIY